MTEKKRQLADQDLDQATGGDSDEFPLDPHIRHKYQCPKCNGTEFKRGMKSINYWLFKTKVTMWLECTTCGAHYPIKGKSDLIMLD